MQIRVDLRDERRVRSVRQCSVRMRTIERAFLLELCGVASLPFAVGVYLPLSTSVPIFVGGVGPEGVCGSESRHFYRLL